MALPFTVIGGFLGAGKTTLLNHWLRHADGRRLAVLVNDFGALNIDATLIESAHRDAAAPLPLMKLTNGCVCCQIGDDLSLALMQVLDAADSFDAVVVEASGVADPWRIAQLGRADPGLRLDGVIVVVDAGAVLEQARDPLLADTLERQLKAADLVVVNHCDAQPDIAPVVAWIAAVAGPVPCLQTRHAVVPPALLSGLAMPQATRAAAQPALHHGGTFDSWSCRPTAVFDAEALRAWLRSPPAGLLRLKGVLRCADPPWVEIQFAGRRGSLRPAAAPADGAALVAIALHHQLPAAALVETFSG
ncbi:MAG TPA: CobW family GTP-binding protein [Burkholderiaceae bacterium]|jgi:G3E family GTPase